MKNNKTYKISDLSPHLFWDVDISCVNWRNNANLIIERVLDYGLISDWQLLRSQYSNIEIERIVKNLPYLKPKSLKFISVYLGIPENKFRCSEKRQLNKAHWIY